MWFQKPPLGTPLDWENPLNKGVVMAPAMNEGHGDRVQDLSMNDNHGKLHNFAYPPTAASGWNPGYKGVELNSDGTDDHINCGHAATSDITGAMTFRAIFYPKSITGNHNIYCRGATNVDGIRILTVGSRVYFFTYQTGASQDTRTGDGAIALGNYYTIAVTREGVRGQIYINGVQLAIILPNHIDPDPSGLRDGLIGAYDTLSEKFVGSIDQPCILNRAYTAKEVKDYAMNPWGVYLDE